jgi:hypothetical protein
MQLRDKIRAKRGVLNEDSYCYLFGHLKYKYGSGLKGGCHEPVNDQFCRGDRGAAVHRGIRRGTVQVRTQGLTGYPLV